MGSHEHSPIPDPKYNKGPSLAELRAAQNELLEQGGGSAGDLDGGQRDASQTDAYDEEVRRYRSNNPRGKNQPDDPQ